MTHIVREEHDGILILKLASGKANALHAAMLDEIGTALQEAAAPAVRGIVLASDRPRFFSAGFDLHEVFQYDRSKMEAFFGRFIDLYEQLLRYPKPVVAALNGHTVAGGAVLALTADQRVMAEGDYAFALNEVKIGVALPAGVLRMAVAAAGFRAASNLVLTGASISPTRALDLGLVHALAPPEDVLEQALVRARNLVQQPPRAFAAIKQMLRREAGFSEQGTDRGNLGTFLDHWFSRESMEARQALAQSIRR